MAVRSTMAALIAKVRTMIYDPAGASQFFNDQTIQDYLDEGREDRRFEPLIIAPSIVNTASTNNLPSTIFADYYSPVKWWEDDIVLQGYFNGASWIVITPVISENLVGHWQFETNVFTSGTVPGQMPPVFATGKVYDPSLAAANLLEMWGASLASAYDFVSDNQSFRRSQLMQAKLTMATYYRRQSKPRIAQVSRSDVQAPLSAKRIHLLDEGDSYMGT